MSYPHKNSQTVKNGAAYIAIALVINMCSWEHANNREHADNRPNKNVRYAKKFHTFKS